MGVTPHIMKIAICMSGLMRTFSECYDSLKENILDIYDCDVFLFVSKTEDKFIKLLNPVKSIVLDADPVLKKENCKLWKMRHYSLQGVLQQLWKIEECYNLVLEYEKEKNFQYDWIIRTRPDLMYHRKLDELYYLPKDYLYLPNFIPGTKIFYMGFLDFIYEHGFEIDLTKFKSVPDQMAIGTHETIEHYSRRYSCLDNYEFKQRLHAERYCRDILMNNNINIRFIRPIMEIKKPNIPCRLSNIIRNPPIIKKSRALRIRAIQKKI